LTYLNLFPLFNLLVAEKIPHILHYISFDRDRIGLIVILALRTGSMVSSQSKSMTRVSPKRAGLLYFAKSG
jgi:hypothetical protein